MMMAARFPERSDPRLPVVALLALYVVCGITVLGFNRSPSQIASVLAMACLLDVVLHRVIKRQWLFPLSAVITGLSLSILVNYAHGSWLAMVPVFFAIASKYLITWRGRHVFNPALFGIVAALLISDNMISVSPSYQWGGYTAVALFIVTAAILTFGLKIQRITLIVSFLLLYSTALAVRAWLTRYHIPPETLFLGMLTSPAFYLFAFFMITDPATSPKTPRGQFLMALTIVLADFFLHTRESLSTFFYAGFAFYTLRWFYLHGTALLSSGEQTRSPFTYHKRLAWVLSVAAVGVVTGSAIGRGGTSPLSARSLFAGVTQPNFKLIEIDASTTGLYAPGSKVMEQVDDRVAHIAKWVLSVGDAAAVADFDKDGLQDVFLSYPLKDQAYRAALYRNLGNFRFKRIPLPALQQRFNTPALNGLPSGALWFDFDNDYDSDLLITVGYGKNVLLKNTLTETGSATFVDVSREQNIDDYAISISSNVLDADRDGDLDLLVGNSLNPWLPDYPEPTRLNIFDLPAAEHPKDRRMYNFMHRTWHDANNGGENYFYLNTDSGFVRQQSSDSGLDGTRWTIDIGTGDLDADGWTDLYLANDFGPDEIFHNREGLFVREHGTLTSHPGRDTYKGMNASFADFDNNGALDIYVSNVHEPLQAEGSLLWMNSGTFANDGWRALQDHATTRNSLNAKRFGWGAATVDLNRDGWTDILQANGMVDDLYDRRYSGCPDYWYWNEKIALTGPDVHGYADRWADLRGRCIFPHESDRVLLNNQQFFVDRATAVGWTSTDASRGIATADFDNDGDADILVTHQFDAVSVYENRAIVEQNWIGLQLIGNATDCNSAATGSRITIVPDSETNDKSVVMQQVHELTASNGFSAQHDSRALFGLGSYQGDIRVTINWCGKETEQLTLTTGDYHTIVQQLRHISATSGQ